MLLVVLRTLLSNEAVLLRFMAWRPSIRASVIEARNRSRSRAANVIEALQKRGSPISILNPLLNWTRRAALAVGLRIICSTNESTIIFS